MEGQYTRTNKYLIVIAGPTAVGKTSSAVRIAEIYGCEIFSADSRQVYAEMNIGTAKPSLQQMKGIKHHLIGHRSILDAYSVGDYVKELEKLLYQYFTQHDVAILTGGTGLYIKSLLEGLDEFPAVPQEITQMYIKMLNNEGIESLQNLLKQKDPQYFEKVDIHNGQRLVRALSVIECSDKPFSSFLTRAKKSLPYIPIKIFIDRPREDLYERINNRVNEMIDNGLIEEVRDLYPHRELRALQTVGYKELFEFINGEVSLSEAVENIQRNSRRYAKRQKTWFRNQGDWHKVHAEDFSNISSYIKSKIGDEFNTKDN